MPHIILEYSANILEKKDMRTLLLTCQQQITDTLPAKLESCKGRAVEHTQFCVGDGNADNAFVHLGLRVLKGRSEEQHKRVGEQLLETLKQHFSQSREKLHLQITVEVGELQEAYFKAVS
jgi:5-carboxymethyl-2-hydroxymuconate isomerase